MSQMDDLDEAEIQRATREARAALVSADEALAKDVLREVATLATDEGGLVHLVDCQLPLEPGPVYPRNERFEALLQRANETLTQTRSDGATLAVPAFMRLLRDLAA